ncbi:MAG: ATP-binding protein [Candidatus Saccharimonadales bacterium]
MSAKKDSSTDDLHYRSALLEAQNEATPDGILVVDTKGDMLFHNKRFVEMWKIPKKIMNDKDDTAALRFAMTRLENPEEFIARVEYLYNHPDEVSHEEIYFTDGQILDRYGVPVVGDDGTKYGWAWYFRDITDTKKRERSLVRQNEYLTALQETALAITKRLEIVPLLHTVLDHAARIAQTRHGYVYLLDETKTKLVVRVVSGVFKDYLGFSLKKGEGMAGRVWKSKKPLVVDDYNNWPNRSSRFPKLLFYAVAGIPLFSEGKVIGVIALGHSKPGQKFQPEEIDALQHLAELASIALDNAQLYKQAQLEAIERKQAEANTEALTEQRTRLLEINQSKDEFISLASHQLRTPATGVKQYIGMLLEGYCGDLTDTQRRLLETAHESNERQLNIVNDLLNVAQVDAGKITLRKKVIDLTAMIRDIITEQAATFKNRRQQAVFKSQAKQVTIGADADRLRMVIENIIDNASKYSPLGSAVTITLKAIKTSVVIQIADTGVGIDPGDQSKLFKKFSRIDNPLSASVGGTGLGLYWAQQIIDLHGGKISVKSKSTQGSTFTITLPLNL